MPALAAVRKSFASEPTLGAIATGQTIAIPEAARAGAIAAIAQNKPSILVAVPTAGDAERLAHDLREFLPEEQVAEFPAWETLPFERVSPALETMGRRAEVLWRVHADIPTVIVAPVRALVQRLGPHVGESSPIEITKDAQLDQDELLAHLISFGYRREYQVEARGECAVRGSIVDVYPSTYEHPIRIDMWGDAVDRLSAFAITDQRSTHEIENARVFPARELRPTADVIARAEQLITDESWGKENWDRIARGELFDGMESWLPWLTPDERLLTDLLDVNTLVLLTEPRRMRDRAQELLDEEEALAEAIAPTWGFMPHNDLPRLSLPFEHLLATTKARSISVLDAPDTPNTPFIAATKADPVAGGEDLGTRIQKLIADGFRVLLTAESQGTARRFNELLAEADVAAPIVQVLSTQELSQPGAHIVISALDHGVVLPSARLAIISEHDVVGRRRTYRKARGAQRGQDFYDDLHVGDFVVHQQHGVGRYAGMVTRAIGGVERDYLLLEYKGNDKLYVPTDQVGIVRRYTGGDKPTLHRLGGADFEKARSRVRKAVNDIAGELVVLYRRRLATSGFAFSPDTPWQQEMEDAFPFEETPDQEKAIFDSKGDMEKPIPMDRLVCGDVGYGKTEVAVRAAFKAVQDGKQVAVLAPTTLLATQHGRTFRERFVNYPIRVEVLSRFLSTKDQTRVVKALANGEVDVVIGTHRLLSDDITFRDLGLLVVDEEQRFGVTHKEKIKKMRTSVDVLTLSATPIPRTLEMSLTGIRDLSLINTPPEDRQPILTYVGEYDERAVTEAIRRELLREGQVFFVHNRVKDIERVTEHVRDLVPDARIGVAHGQMDETRLEQVVIDFWERKYDVLVCTTIVESGLDIPNVNTLIVDDAHRFGLAQMYQLRGRVGRRSHRAYAYLMFPPNRSLTEEAYERLRTIGEFTDLGSGFKIAMRDLEIRGAGNLLGGEQSGHIAAVGFDMYCQMVTEAVGELMGTTPETPAEISIDVPVNAYLPREYVARDDVRMEAYRKLAAVVSDDDVNDIELEWSDRYGEPPEPAVALLQVARLRAACVKAGVVSLSVQRNQARIVGLALKESQKIRLQRLRPASVVKAGGEVVVPVSGNSMRELSELLTALAA